MPRLSATRCAALASLSALAACDGSMPGELVGAYSVVMQLETNSCGRAVTPFPDGERYAVELRQEGTRGYWRLTRGLPVAGTLSDAGFRFTHQQTIELGALDAGTLGCTVVREEELTGALEGLDARDGGPPREDDDEGALRGEHRVSFRPDPDGRCRDERGPLREFERLPCEAHYRLDGTPRAPF